MIEQLTSGLLERLSGWAIVDILLLAFIFYQILILIRGTRAAQMVVGIAVLVLGFLLTGESGPLPLRTVHEVLARILFYVPVAIIVLFQREIRRALASFGRNPFARLAKPVLQDQMIEDIALASTAMATQSIGALIVIERQHGLRNYVETGIELDAAVSYDLLLNIFSPNTPLHDGAVIVSDGRIQGASCFLPLTSNPTITREYGTRHRAAIGVTEETDALAVVVSEEQGAVSLARNGVLRRDLDTRTLRALLREHLNVEPEKNVPDGAKDAATAETS